MWSREQVRWVLGAIFAIPIILGILIIIRLIGVLSTVPVAIGKRVDVEEAARKLVHLAVDIEIAYQFRDDLLLIMEEHIYQSELNPDDYDRWGLLRQIDSHREEAIENLQTGELVLSIGGAIVSIIVGLLVDVRLIGIGLTVVLIFLSILVILRVVVTDLLSYRSGEVRNDNIESLLLKRGWNENQINHGSALVWATILLTTSSSERGYELGLKFVEKLGAKSNRRATERYSAEKDSGN